MMALAVGSLVVGHSSCHVLELEGHTGVEPERHTEVVPDWMQGLDHSRTHFQIWRYLSYHLK
jgi:hypothetical protein